MSGETTHYLLFGDPFTPVRGWSALCGQPAGPIDLTPYNGLVSCVRCREIDARRRRPHLCDGRRAAFFGAAGPMRLRP